jgi:DNA polymerase-3 subunit chi
MDHQLKAGDGEFGKMTETFFYHLERRTLEEVLPGLVEKSLERGWRALIRTDSAERSEALDTLLWTYDEQSFLPHAQMGDGDAARQKVLITMEEENPNAAAILFCVGGAPPSDWSDARHADLARIVLLFEGRDGAALAGARQAWKAATASGHAVTYWKEAPSGKFEKQN